MSSTLDLASREQSARGAGSNTETITLAWAQPDPAYTATRQALARATRPDYFAWLEHIKAAAGCTRPIRLSGSLSTVEATTGRLLNDRHTDTLPDAAIYKACGNRRATVCPSCAQTYQRDAYQLLRAGLVGGKGVPATVAAHPAVFVTFTAPSFGTVHNRIVRKHTCADRRRCDCRAEPCHARRDTGTCTHGQPAVCWARHEHGEPILGQPLCLDCYDHDHQAVFNLFAPELWHRTKQAAERSLRKLCRRRGIPFHPVVSANGKVTYKAPLRLSPGKVAEMQRRGAVHFHALVRLDGVNPDDPADIVAPPAGIGLDDLVDAIAQAAHDIAFSTPSHPDRPDGWPIAWGDEGKDRHADIRPISLTGDGNVTDGMVAGYLAKYATKSTEATGFSSTRLDADSIGQHRPDGNHIDRLIAACWRLGRNPENRTGTGAGLRAYRGYVGPLDGTFGDPWDCPDCGTHTRYRACPVCIAERQASLDTEPASTSNPNPYARLRRWAHMLGFGGHFLTKARRYSTTFGELRAARIAYRRHEPQALSDAHPHAVTVAEHLQPETTLLIGTLTFAGVGWHNHGDALLANTAAALARARQQAGHEEIAHELGSSITGAQPVAA
jgi:hypothetical protein